MPKNTTAGTFISRRQAGFAAIAVIAFAVLGIISVLLLVQIIAALILLFIFAFVTFKFILVEAGRRYKHLSRYNVQEDHPDLPVYTIYAPMFGEPQALPSLLEGISRLRYDKDKLQVLLLLEARSVDEVTWNVLDGLDLPHYVEVVELPIRKIRNKPTALNVGLALTRGDFAVIYDAEDRPEPDQLLKSVGTFWNTDDTVACLQARLRFSNETETFVSRALQLEYDIHFRQLLPGLAQHNLIPPLGGTSNHFRVSALRAIASDERLTPELQGLGLGAWDSWNSTEDAELAGRFYEMNYTIAMLDSVTYEVATTTLRKVIPQRSRWQKGYVATWLTYTRNIRYHVKTMGFKRWACYILFLMGTTQSMILSTITWVVTIVYFSTSSSMIESVFPWPLLYLGTFLLVFGNFAIWVQHIAAAITHCKPSSAFYTPGLLLWQQLATLSHLIAVWELMVPSKRYDWRKTPHEANFESLQRAMDEEVSSKDANTVPIPVLSSPPKVRADAGITGRHRQPDTA